MVVDRAMLQGEHGGGDRLLPYLNDFYVKLRSRLVFLEHADTALASVFPFNKVRRPDALRLPEERTSPPEGDAWALDAGVDRTVFGKGTMR